MSPCRLRLGPRVNEWLGWLCLAPCQGELGMEEQEKGQSY